MYINNYRCCEIQIQGRITEVSFKCRCAELTEMPGVANLEKQVLR